MYRCRYYDTSAKDFKFFVNQNKIITNTTADPDTTNKKPCVTNGTLYIIFQMARNDLLSISNLVQHIGTLN